MHLLRSKAMIAALAATASVGAVVATSASATVKPAMSGLTVGLGDRVHEHFTAMARSSRSRPKGKGKIAAILPDTTCSTRYTEFDRRSSRRR